MRAKRIRPIRPGAHLRDQLEGRNISLNQLSRDTRIPLSRISAIANGKRAVTADTALRFGRYFDKSPSMWLGDQSDYDLQAAMADAGRIEREVIPAAASAA
ncbi:MAG: HigA family addiction module antitoxin [Acidobacteriota bacterium]